MSDAPTIEKRPDYLTAKQLADVLQVSETTINRLRRAGKIPAVYVTDRLVRYVLRDVRRALAKSTERDNAPLVEPTRDDEAQMGFADLVEEFDLDR